MSNDLISRSALRKKVNSFFDSQYEGIVSSDLIKYAEAVDDFIDNAPTVDTTFREVVAYECGQKSVEERPKGKWYYNYQNGWHCSICNKSVKDMPTVMGKADFNFCPNCGARMER